MTEAERAQVLAIFRNEGFKPINRQPSKALSGKYAKKLQALWIAGYNLGVFRDRRDSALLAFVKRQTASTTSVSSISPTMPARRSRR